MPVWKNPVPIKKGGKLYVSLLSVDVVFRLKRASALVGAGLGGGIVDSVAFSGCGELDAIDESGAGQH
jgi:hypothetical protein